jgi:hypothetical protein
LRRFFPIVFRTNDAAILSPMARRIFPAYSPQPGTTSACTVTLDDADTLCPFEAQVTLIGQVPGFASREMTEDQVTLPPPPTVIFSRLISRDVLGLNEPVIVPEQVAPGVACTVIATAFPPSTGDVTWPNATVSGPEPVAGGAVVVAAGDGDATDDAPGAATPNRERHWE